MTHYDDVIEDLFTAGISDDEALRNVANTVMDLTVVTRYHNGKNRSRTYNGDIDAIASAARQLADMVLNAADTCLWTLHADGYYETQCGQAYTAFDGGLDENHYRYCPWCGRAIVEAHDAEEQSEDE